MLQSVSGPKSASITIIVHLYCLETFLQCNVELTTILACALVAAARAVLPVAGAKLSCGCLAGAAFFFAGAFFAGWLKGRD